MEDGWEQLFDKSFTNRDRSTLKMKGYIDERFLAALEPNTPNILNVPLFLAAYDVLKTPRSTIVWYRVVDGTLKLKITETVTLDRDDSVGNSATMVITPFKIITETDIKEKRKCVLMTA